MTARKKEMVLRVFMENTTDGIWKAICIDLDIAAQGHTSAETQQLIVEMIESYIEEANSYPSDVRNKLLNRKAPLHLRICLPLKFFIASMFANRSRGDKMSILSHHHCHA